MERALRRRDGDLGSEAGIVRHFAHHIGDYAAATAHLTFVEDAAYHRLLRLYYRDEAPLPGDIAACQRLAGARTKEERAAIETVLREFFDLRDDGWHQTRADDEIKVYQNRAQAGRENGHLGGRPKGKLNRTKTGHVPDKNHNQEPLTKNQEPSVSNSAPVGASQSAKSKLIPDDYEPSAEDRAVLLKEMPWLEPMWDKRVAEFRDWCIANATRTFNPAATFRGFMRQTRQPRVTGNKPGGVTGNGRSHTASDDNWPWRLTKWREDKFWLATWGPEPGKPGCFVPREFLQ